MFTSDRSGAPVHPAGAESPGMLPMPESPVPSNSSLHFRHHYGPSTFSGAHSPSPLAQNSLMASSHLPGPDTKGKSPNHNYEAAQ